MSLLLLLSLFKYQRTTSVRLVLGDFVLPLMSIVLVIFMLWPNDVPVYDDSRGADKELGNFVNWVTSGGRYYFK